MDTEANQLDPEKIARIGDLCMCANLRRASRMVTAIYDTYLQPSGLLATQFILLASLGAQPSIALTPLAEKLGMDPTTLARNLKPLERDGLVEIFAGTDRRVRVLRLTDQGTAALRRALPLWEQAQAAVIRQVGEDRARLMLADWADLSSLAG
ncbi:MAG TPA: MarR family transcriptional regulator [Phototrophicaceae bacterium]|nr:MarR family transcriptional regulator [Phototrophicaceae bacterium]